jgi:very-short-patch-repair endonuclease
MGKDWHLIERAREMRREPTEPEKRLWRHLSNRQLGGYKFRRQATIEPYIADFPLPGEGAGRRGGRGNARH